MTDPHQHRSPLILAHRGLPFEFPENSLSGFRCALAAGADGVELDVTLLADRTPVVHHDADLLRCSQHPGYLRDLHLEALNSISISAAFPDHPTEKIPTLEQAIALLNQHQCWLNLELKDHGLDADRVAAAVVPLLHQFHNPEQLIVSSFSLPLLRACRQQSTRLQLGLLYEALPADWATTATRLNAFSIHPHWQSFDSDQAQAIKAAGLRLYLWTVDQPDSIEQLWPCVDAIISNRPQLFLAQQ